MLIRVDFKTQDLEDLIQQKGYLCLWSQVAICACIDPATTHPVPDCIQCDGRGKFYYNTQQIKGIITRQNKELQIGDVVGTLNPGDAYITTSHTNFLAPFDMITNLDSTTLYTELLFHSESNGDFLRYPAVGNVIEAITQPTRTSPISVLQQNVDFTVSGNEITWTSQKKPADKAGVTFRYMYNPVWIITSIINYVRDTFVKLNNPVDTATAMPVRAQMRLEYLGVGNTQK